MQQFSFQVVNADNPEETVPVSVAGKIMIDVQTLLSDVGELLLRRELRTQNSLPEWAPSRFELRADGNCSGEDEGNLMDDALTILCSELDRANLYSDEPETTGNRIEASGRKKIASDVLTLYDDLNGYVLTYGVEGNMRKFRMNNREALETEANTDLSLKPYAIIGVVEKDSSSGRRWTITNGVDRIPLRYAVGVSQDDARSFAEAGPVIAVGKMIENDGKVSEIRDVTDCYLLPLVKFRRIVTRDRDILLLNPAIACPGYDYGKGLWTLNQDDLGIRISKPSWDAAVMAFHEYFAFLWETYAESEEEFEGEEEEVRQFLKSLAFPRLDLIIVED